MYVSAKNCAPHFRYKLLGAVKFGVAAELNAEDTSALASSIREKRITRVLSSMVAWGTTGPNSLYAMALSTSAFEDGAIVAEPVRTER